MAGPPAPQPTDDNFYPRPPRGGRPVGAVRDAGDRPISIHALREEGDSVARMMSPAVIRFLSTPSARRATKKPKTPC